MKFNESGLPQTKNFKEAFEYSHKYLLSLEAESLHSVKMQLEAIRKQKMSALEKKRLSGELSDFKIIEAEKDIEDQIDAQLKQAPKLIRDRLEENFANIVITKSRILMDHSDKLSDDLLLASLLIEAAATPAIIQDIEDKFGKGVSAIILEASNVDSDPKMSKSKLNSASPDLKRLYEASLISKMEETSKKIENLRKKSPKVKLAKGQENLLFSSATAIWGNDAGLDKKFFNSFKDFVKYSALDIKVILDVKGNMVLTKAKPKLSNDNSSSTMKPKKPNPGKGSFKF